MTAIPAGIRLVRQHEIDVVVSTSPPPSTHLIAAAIARATGARWVADLRDSLVAHAHRRADTVATRAKAATHRRVAQLVASRADAITCVSEAISEETRALEPRGPVVTIPNGCDFDDVVGLERSPSDRFRLTHTGSFFGRRDPRPFLQALSDSGLDVVTRFLGDFREADRKWADGLELGDRLELIPYAPRSESLALQRDSEALLLLIPEADGRGKGVLSGKVFEYIAVGRPILAVVPPDGAAAELIRETGAGVVAPPDDPSAIRAALDELHARWRDGGLPDVGLTQWRDRLSRRTRVEEMATPTSDVLPAAGNRISLVDSERRHLCPLPRSSTSTSSAKPLDAIYLHPELIPVAPQGRLKRARCRSRRRIDDYHAIEACRVAVDDYRRSHAVDEALHTIDWMPSTERRRRAPRTIRLRATAVSRGCRRPSSYGQAAGRRLLRLRHARALAWLYPQAFADAERQARANAALDYVDRQVGGGNSVLPDQAVVIEAQGRIPTDETFLVAVGDPQEGWSELSTPDAIATFMRSVLLPRRESADAPWILCFACDRGAYPDAEPVWEDEEGLSILRRGG